MRAIDGISNHCIVMVSPRNTATACFFSGPHGTYGRLRWYEKLQDAAHVVFKSDEPTETGR